MSVYILLVSCSEQQYPNKKNTCEHDKQRIRTTYLVEISLLTPLPRGKLSPQQYHTEGTQVLHQEGGVHKFEQALPQSSYYYLEDSW